MRFEHCTFCGGKGCLACEGELKKYEAERTERIKHWKPPTEEEAEFATSIIRTLQLGMGENEREDEIRHVVHLPPPVATIQLEGNESLEEELELAKQFIGGDALVQLHEESRGDPQAFNEKFLENAEGFRVEQRKLQEKKK